MDGFPERKHNRISGFDYSSALSYFITICTKPRINRFWTPARDGSLSGTGLVVAEEIRKLPERFPLAGIDIFTVMPDHVHLIITLFDDPKAASSASRPDIRNVVGYLKAKVSKRIGSDTSIWQKSFYDHVIRDDEDYAEIWYYIEANPRRYINNKSFHTGGN